MYYLLLLLSTLAVSFGIVFWGGLYGFILFWAGLFGCFAISTLIVEEQVERRKEGEDDVRQGQIK